MRTYNSLLRYTCIAVFVMVMATDVAAQDETQSPAREKIEEFAKFPGGSDKFYEYISTNLEYPTDALKDSIGGVVYVEFSLTNAGAIDKNSVKVIKSLSASCDEEALRLIKGGPAWSPARSKVAAISQVIIFPVSFEWKKE